MPDLASVLIKNGWTEEGEGVYESTVYFDEDGYEYPALLWEISLAEQAGFRLELFASGSSVDPKMEGVFETIFLVQQRRQHAIFILSEEGMLSASYMWPQPFGGQSGEEGFQEVRRMADLLSQQLEEVIAALSLLERGFTPARAEELSREMTPDFVELIDTDSMVYH